MNKKLPEITHYASSSYFDSALPAKVISHRQQLSIWHDHNFYELVLVISGNGFHKTLQRKTPIQSGTILFLKLGDVHSYQVENSAISLINVLIKPDFFKNSFSSKLLAGIEKTDCIARIIPQTQIYQRLLNNLQTLKREADSQNDFKEEMFISLLLESLCITARYFNSFTKNKKTRKYGDLIIKYINENCDNEPCMDEISKLTGLSETYITRNFKNITGYKFVELVNEYRIKKACDLLSEGNADINDIYREIGYKSKVYFYRAFKCAIGISPLQYKKIIKQS